VLHKQSKCVSLAITVQSGSRTVSQVRGSPLACKGLTDVDKLPDLDDPFFNPSIGSNSNWSLMPSVR
jgi:hypothetical protein